MNESKVIAVAARLPDGQKALFHATLTPEYKWQDAITEVVEKLHRTTGSGPKVVLCQVS